MEDGGQGKHLGRDWIEIYGSQPVVQAENMGERAMPCQDIRATGTSPLGKPESRPRRRTDAMTETVSLPHGTARTSDG